MEGLGSGQHEHQVVLEGSQKAMQENQRKSLNNMNQYKCGKLLHFFQILPDRQHFVQILQICPDRPNTDVLRDLWNKAVYAIVYVIILKTNRYQKWIFDEEFH